MTEEREQPYVEHISWGHGCVHPWVPFTSKQRLLAPSAGLAHTSTVLALCLPRTQAATLNADRLSGLAPCQQALCEARAVCSRKTTESDFYT